jgi:hypothetical protein
MFFRLARLCVKTGDTKIWTFRKGLQFTLQLSDCSTKAGECLNSELQSSFIPVEATVHL